jgi:hypothetical protein
MVDDQSQEKRKYPRFDTELDIKFRVNYDIKTKLDYQEIDKEKHTALTEKRSALSQNVSAEGICFVSDELVEIGTFLYLEVYVPNSEKPVCMEGEVRWSREVKDDKKGNHFLTGVQLAIIDGEKVEKTIFFDEAHQMTWSAVLESTLGQYRIIGQQRDKENS